MTTWAHLPNAALIDEVLASVRTSPEEWTAARDAARGAARDAAWGAAWDAARDAAQAAARNTAWRAARSASWNVARDADLDAAWGAAWSATAMLIAYDDAGQFMKLPVEHLRRLHRIDPHPMFLLLQPAAIVFMGVEP
jgi:hypothetical protein